MLCCAGERIEAGGLLGRLGVVLICGALDLGHHQIDVLLSGLGRDHGELERRGLKSRDQLLGREADLGQLGLVEELVLGDGTRLALAFEIEVNGARKLFRSGILTVEKKE